MNNKKKMTAFILMMAMVVTLGSAVVARKMARDSEEVITGDMIDNEHRVDDVTIEGNKLVYKDNSVRYTKYVILQYAGNTDKYTEDTYYWFNNINEYQLALFIKQNDNIYKKYEEVHYQRAYSLVLIQKMLETNGFTVLEINDEYSDEKAKEDSEIVTIIAQKKC